MCGVVEGGVVPMACTSVCPVYQLNLGSFLSLKFSPVRPEMGMNVMFLAFNDTCLKNTKSFSLISLNLSSAQSTYKETLIIP